MSNKKWVYLLISILCIVTFIGSYLYGYKPYAEKKLLRDNYNAIVSLYGDFEQYKLNIKKQGSHNGEVMPLSAEKEKVVGIRKDLYEITGKINTNDNKNTLKMMIKATYDLEKIINAQRDVWLSVYGESKQLFSLDDTLELIIQRAEQETEFKEKTLPLIKGYVE